MSSGSTSRNHIVANPEGLSATTVLLAFGEWLDQRLAEAMRLDMDLAFRDRPFDIEVDRTPALVGWEHRYLAPGAAAPKGRLWTVYRLQDQTGRPAPLPRHADDYADTVTPLLGELGYLGVFDGEPALFPGVGTR
ncbi:hypothetical protein PMI01_01295 [Caulobacter sp. AP07]|uniref:hypothetical protein n=1 Tax=Caulobacter sp. AP07 TaxID=1144304 RepID=UPI000271FC2C|nr:hypothetical protein [Caulobacter sp. AP07]EJL35542.1 hypothetical protein PMI01_01295 [Caulobacter sp. AP07]